MCTSSSWRSWSGCAIWKRTSTTTPATRPSHPRRIRPVPRRAGPKRHAGARPAANPSSRRDPRSRTARSGARNRAGLSPPVSDLSNGVDGRSAGCRTAHAHPRVGDSADHAPHHRIPAPYGLLPAVSDSGVGRPTVHWRATRWLQLAPHGLSRTLTGRVPSERTGCGDVPTSMKLIGAKRTNAPGYGRPSRRLQRCF